MAQGPDLDMLRSCPALNGPSLGKAEIDSLSNYVH